MDANEAWAKVIGAVRRSASRSRDGNLILTKLTLETDEEIEAVEMLLNIDMSSMEPRYFLDDMTDLRTDLNYHALQKAQEQGDWETHNRYNWYSIEWTYSTATAEWYQAMAVFMQEVYYPLRGELYVAKERDYDLASQLNGRALISNEKFMELLERIYNMGIALRKE